MPGATELMPPRHVATATHWLLSGSEDTNPLLIMGGGFISPEPVVAPMRAARAPT